MCEFSDDVVLFSTQNVFASYVFDQHCVFAHLCVFDQSCLLCVFVVSSPLASGSIFSELNEAGSLASANSKCNPGTCHRLLC